MRKPQFQFVLCPGKDPQPEYKDLYENIYNCWFQVWNEAFLQIHAGHHNQASDNFTRQDFIGAILVDGVCKAMSVYKHTDASSEALKKDSYFSCWSDKHIEKLTSQGPKVLVCSHFTIHSSARKDAVGLSMRDLLMGLTSEVCYHSKADAMTGAMRKSRNVHGLAVDWGAELIDSDVPSGHGDELVDLVVFFKDKVRMKRNHELVPLIYDLWKNRIVIERKPVEEVADFKAPTFVRVREAS